MRNTEKIAAAVAKFIGKELTSKMIVGLTLEMFPGTNQGSILPSDHAGPNPRSGVIYADQLFQRTANGYLVLPVDKRTRKPATGRSTETLQDAVKAARALLAVTDGNGKADGKANVAVPAVTVPAIPAIVAGKPDGKAIPAVTK